MQNRKVLQEAPLEGAAARHSVLYRDDPLEVAALQALEKIPHDHIRLTVREGEVTLDGQVGSCYERVTAESIMRHLQGVRHVVSHLEVLPGLSLDEVRGRIQSAVRQAAEADAREIRVESLSGKVRISGHVGTEQEHDAALTAARHAPGVLEVEDCLDVQARAA